MLLSGVRTSFFFKWHLKLRLLRGHIYIRQYTINGRTVSSVDFKRGFQKLFVFNDTIEGPRAWASVTNVVRSAALQDFGSDTGFFYTDMKERAVHFHDQPTVLYCVPTNPGPRSFCARPVYWCRCARPLDHFLNCPKGKSPQLPKFTNPNPRYNPEIPNF